jgi:hypothetical protein
MLAHRTSPTLKATQFCGLQLLTVLLACFPRSVTASSPSHASNVGPASENTVQSVLRWGKQPNETRTAEIVSDIGRIFTLRNSDLNFSKRGLRSLLEQANPSSLARISPFRPAQSIPQQFFFENFAPIGYLVGEKNPRVPPILAETETADWLELKAHTSIPLARELSPLLPAVQPLRALSLQGTWSSEIYSTPWNKHFDSAAALIEAGGIRCLKKNPKAGPNSAMVELPAHVRCTLPAPVFGKDNPFAQQLPKKLAAPQASTHPSTVTANAVPSPSCQPAGRLGMQTLELMGDEKGGHCLLWRVSQDERFQHRRISSKLICLNTLHKSFQRTRFHSVVSVLPSAIRKDEVHLVEAEDGNLNTQRLNLLALSLTKTDFTTSSGQNLRNSSFPQQRTGLYVCRQSNPSPSASPLMGPPVTVPPALEWVYLEDSVYAGLRPAKLETEVAWRFRENTDATLNIERLSWAQLQYDHPSITSERAFACVTSRNIDAKCGLRVLQTALQISEEWLSGEFERTEVPAHVQITTALLLAQSLEKVAEELPDWALREENESLLTFFQKKAEVLAGNNAFTGNPPHIEPQRKKRYPTRRYLDIPSDSQDYLSIKKSLTSAGDFWALLKQKPL